MLPLGVLNQEELIIEPWLITSHMLNELSNKIKELKVAVTIAAYDLTSEGKKVKQEKRIDFSDGREFR